MNNLEQALDHALYTALEAREKGTPCNTSIMVTGDPASDNQILIGQWAEKHNIMVFNCGNVLLSDGSYYREKNGILSRQEDKSESLLPLLSSHLTSMDKNADYIVLFHLYNWQDNAAYRESILPFVTEKMTLKNSSSTAEFEPLPNVLFCVASVVQQNYGEEFVPTEKEQAAFPVKLSYSHYA